MNVVNVHWILFGKPYKIAHVRYRVPELFPHSVITTLHLGSPPKYLQEHG